MGNLQSNIIVYGANGYSAQLIIEELVQRGYKPVLSGRNEKAVCSTAEKYNCNYKIFDLVDEVIIKAAILEFDFLVNCAGPFKYTARQLIDACIATKTHYLDITGEIPIIEYASSKDEEAKSAGVVLAPSVGFDVVPTDCLARSLFNVMPDAVSLQLGLMNKNGKISRGTWLTTLEILSEQGKIRKDSKIVDSELGEFIYSINRSDFHFNGISIPWGDVASAYYSTGINNITVYLGIPRAIFKFKGMIKYLRKIATSKFIRQSIVDSIKKNISGPTLKERNTGETFLCGKVENEHGDSIEKCFQIMEGYNTTQKSSVDIIQKLITTEILPGTKTPSMIMGSDYFEEFVIKKIF